MEFAVELEDWLLENLNQSYVVPEDFTQYRKLVRPTAKGIFVYLYVWFYASRGKDVEKDYGELCALLNVRCYQHASKIRETMGLSLDDLVSIGYLKAWDIKPMLSKKGFKLVLTPGRAILEVIANTQRRQLAQSRTEHGQLSPAQEQVKTSLLARGVAEDKALAISRVHDPEVVEEQIEFLDAEIGRDGGKRIKNPAGFIISFIDGAKTVPHTFESQKKRAERRALLEEQEKERDARVSAELANMEFRERYERWRKDRADEAIGEMYSSVDLERRLKKIRAEVSKDQRLGQMFDRLTSEHRREQLMRILRKEVASELSLLTFEEWAETNVQGVLFQQ